MITGGTVGGKPLSERSSRLSCSYRGATYTFSRQTSQLWIIRLASRFLSILLRRNICLFDKVSFGIKCLPPSGRFKSSFQTISSLSFESVWECEEISNDTNEDLNIDKYICLFWKAANQICWSFWREGTKISAFSNINQGNKEYLYAIYFDICAIISLVHFRRWSPMFFLKNLKWSPTVKKVKSNGCWTSLFYRWTSLFIEVKSNGKKVKSNGCWTSLFFKVKSNTCAPFPR